MIQRRLEEILNYLDNQVKLLESNYEANRHEGYLLQITALLKMKTFILGLEDPTY